jgi:acyl-CoA synthetase (AMP-forming)/AMP-acid ligase II
VGRTAGEKERRVTTIGNYATLLDMMRARAEDGHSNGYWFVADNEASPPFMSFQELERRARDIAAELSMIAPQGSRAIVICPPGPDFIAAFFGAVYAGITPVPVPPPGSEGIRQALGRLGHVIADASPEALIATSALVAASDAARLGATPTIGHWLAIDEVRPGSGDGWVPPRVTADDVALVQYTSGSTAAPKGVVVRHRQVLANLDAIRVSLALSASSTAVCWVPSYHDMGLIAFILLSMYLGSSACLIPPQDFLRRPAVWLETISKFGGAFSGGPNFAFELCTRRISESELESLDLSSWQVAFSAAELVRPEVLRRFCQRFGRQGFDPNALCPCYGLAEASVFASGSKPGSGVGVAWLNRRALEQGLVQPAKPGTADAVEVASCGRPPEGHRVVLADPETRSPANSGTVGEIWFEGPSVAAGYWGRIAESEEVFHAKLADREGTFLRTGDLGFLRDGELYITGRIKDLMIMFGRNIYPTDVEDAAQSVARTMRRGCGASFLVGGDSTDLVIVQETSEEDTTELSRLALAVRRAVLERLDIAVADIVFIRPRTIAKTSSGKLRRRACRDDYLAGRLDVAFQVQGSWNGLASKQGVP